MRKEKNEKIFCIGLNKTGTTSLGSFFEKNNLYVANQNEGELLLKSYLLRDFNSIIDYIKKSKADVFQDVPFSLPFTFAHLDLAFPKSKFILTIRNSDEDWYQSILKFHSDFYNNKKKPTYESLKDSEYVYKGWSEQVMFDVFITDKNNMYDKDEFKMVYNSYNKSVINYFKNKPDKLIVINLGIKNDFERLCSFLKISTNENVFPKITSKDILNGNFNCKFLK